MKLLLLALALLGLDAIGGYITFHLLLSSRCSHLLVETESRQKTALKELQAKNQKVTDDYMKCMHEEGTKQQLLELQGRLEAQSILAERHQELTQRYHSIQQTYQQQLEDERRHHANIVDEQRVTIEQLQDKLEATTSNDAAVRELEQAHQKMEVTRMDMEHFRERLDICVSERQRMEREVNQLQVVLQERDEHIHQLNGVIERLELERDEEEEYGRRSSSSGNAEEQEQHYDQQQEGEEYHPYEEERGGGEEEGHHYHEEGGGGEGGEEQHHYHEGDEEHHYHHEEEEHPHHNDQEQGGEEL